MILEMWIQKLQMQQYLPWKDTFWYLTAECVSFVLFSDQISAAEKKKIAQQLLKVKSTKALDMGVSTFPVLNRSFRLASLVGKQSWFLFDVLKIGSQLLNNIKMEE